MSSVAEGDPERRAHRSLEPGALDYNRNRRWVRPCVRNITICKR
jgi:hypothetical protein